MKKIYIEAIQKNNPDRCDNIIVNCGGREFKVCSFFCLTEKNMRDKYSNTSLSNYSTLELLEEITKRIKNN